MTPLVEHQIDRARNGQLVLQHCDHDDTTWYPAAEHCPQCLGKDWTWKQATGRATLWSWARIHQPYLKVFSDEIPYLVAYVQLEEGPLLISTLVGTATDELTIDDPLTLEFEEYGVDAIPLPVFRPATS